MITFLHIYILRFSVFWAIVVENSDGCCLTLGWLREEHRVSLSVLKEMYTKRRVKSPWIWRQDGQGRRGVHYYSRALALYVVEHVNMKLTFKRVSSTQMWGLARQDPCDIVFSRLSTGRLFGQSSEPLKTVRV